MLTLVVIQIIANKPSTKSPVIVIRLKGISPCRNIVTFLREFLPLLSLSFCRNEVVVSWLPPRGQTLSDNKIIGYILYKTFKPPTSNQLRTEEITLNASTFGSGTAYAQIEGLKQGIYYVSVSGISH